MTGLRVVVPLLATLAGCESEPLPDACHSAPVPIDPAGTTTVWVVDSVDLPSTATKANQLGFNLDCDEQGRPDNALGQIVATIYSYESSDLDAEVAALIAEGKLLHLMTLQSTGLVDATGVGLTLQHGIDLDGDPTDNFSGDEPFAVDPSIWSGTTSGDLVAGHLSLRGGELPLGLILPTLDEPVILPIDGARVEADVSGGRIEGRIGGAVPRDAVTFILIPFIYTALQRAIDRDCTGVATLQHRCGCQAGSFGETLIDLFDEEPTGGDCVISLDELRNNSLASSLLAPDVDLLDQDGVVDPRADGVKDSLSLGIGFTAVPARLEQGAM